MFRKLRDQMLKRSQPIIDPFVPPSSPTGSPYVVPHSPRSPSPFTPTQAASPEQDEFLERNLDTSSAAAMMPITQETLDFLLLDRKSEIEHIRTLERRQIASRAGAQEAMAREDLIADEFNVRRLFYEAKLDEQERIAEATVERERIAREQRYTHMSAAFDVTQTGARQTIIAEESASYRQLMQQAYAFPTARLPARTKIVKPDRNPKNVLIRKGIKDSSVISNILNGTLNITDIYIYSNGHSFVAVLNQGTALFSWGDPNSGGTVPPIPPGKRVKRIYASNGAYAALLHDRSFICWGDANYGGIAPIIPPGRTIENICSSGYGFAARLDDSSLLLWGGVAREDQYHKKLNISEGCTVKEIYGGTDFIAATLSNNTIACSGQVGLPPIIPPGATILSIFTGICIYAAIFNNGWIMYWGPNFSRIVKRGPKPFLPPGRLIKEWHFAGDCFIAILDDGSVLYDWITEDKDILGRNCRFPLPKILPSSAKIKSFYPTQISISILFHDGTIFFAVHPNYTKEMGAGFPWLDQINPAIPPDRTVVNIYANTFGAYVAHLDNKRIVCWGTSAYGGITPVIHPYRTVVNICPGSDSFAAALDSGEIIHWGTARGIAKDFHPINQRIRIPAGCYLSSVFHK